jgi:Fe2+ transport system protein FeoA
MSHADAASADVARPLCDLRPGEVGRVVEKRLDEADRAVLRAMGLRQDATVRLCRAGEPCIVAVMSGSAEGCTQPGCRIGLARPLAERVFVRVNTPAAKA